MLNYETSDVCIPRLQNSIEREYIYQVFCKMRVGKIKRITEIPLRNDIEHKRVFVRIQWNGSSQNTKYIQERFSKGENVKIVHDDSPWYWKIVAITR